jgi:hypothetical protein
LDGDAGGTRDRPGHRGSAGSGGCARVHHAAVETITAVAGDVSNLADLDRLYDAVR